MGGAPIPPSIALTIVGLAASGLAVVGAVGSLWHTRALPALALPEAGALVRIGGALPIFNVYDGAFVRRDALASVFAGVAAHATVQIPTGRPPAGGTPIPPGTRVETVSAEFFQTVGVQPQRGEPPHRRGLVLSARLSRHLFGDVDAVGREVQLFGRPLMVAGVMPPGFDYPAGTDVWTQIAALAPDTQAPVEFIGRLRPGVTLRDAAGALRSIGETGSRVRGTFGAPGPIVQAMAAYLNRQRAPYLRVVPFVGALFLLVAAAGIGHIAAMHWGVESRSPTDGAGRAGRGHQWRRDARAIAPFVACGGLLALGLSVMIAERLQLGIPALHDARSFAFATIGVVGALCPVLSLFASGLVRWHAATRRDPPAVARHGPLREVVVALHVGLALLALVTAGALLKSEELQRGLPDGVDGRSVTVVRPASRADAGDAAREWTDGRRLRRLHGVIASGVLHPIPLSSVVSAAPPLSTGVSVRDPRLSSHRTLPLLQAILGRASPEGFAVVGVQPVHGRAFTDQDVEQERALQDVAARARHDRWRTYEGVAVINDALAQRLWPSGDGLGQTFADGGPVRRTVVGIVQTFRAGASGRTMPAAFYPFAGAPHDAGVLVRLRAPSSRHELAAQLSALRSDPSSGLAAFSIESPPNDADDATATLRLLAEAASALAVLTLVVAWLATYASFAAPFATAVGAGRVAARGDGQQVRRFVLTRVVITAGVAVPVALMCAWLVGRWLTVVLVQFTAFDVVVYARSSVAVLAAVVAAAVAAARRGVAVPLPPPAAQR